MTASLPSADSPARLRATGLALAFVVDVANISRAGGDLLEPLVFAAVVQANQAALRREGEARRLYGDSGEAIPDDLRRPISINAVAQSLRLPFETVRRKVQRLIARGQCVATPAGVYVPQAVIAGERHAAIQSARLARLERFHDELVEAGFLAPSEALPRPLPAALTRTVNRALSEYMLRSCDQVAELAGGVLEGFVLLGLCVALPEGGPEPPRPCSTRVLAQRIGMPEENVRRRLIALAGAGYARRASRGWLPAAPTSDHARIARIVDDHEADLRRLFARLRELVELA